MIFCNLLRCFIDARGEKALVSSNLNRDKVVDVLRSIAIFLIIYAHTPKIDQVYKDFRVFDVPLMTILLGVSYILSTSKESSNNYLPYLKKRFIRLIIPTWKFLAFYFIMWRTIYFLFGKNIFTLKQVIESFLLYDGIGFVWIIRIFFLIAVISPLLKRIAVWSNGYSRNTLVFIVFSLTYGALIKLYYATGGNTFYESMVLETYSYCFLALIGMIITLQGNRGRFSFLIFGLIVFILSGLDNGFNLLQQSKYPPLPYYLSYGVCISMILLSLMYKIDHTYFGKIFGSKGIRFVSNNSMNIYYAHIFYLPIINRLPINNGYILFVLLSLISLLTVVMYSLIIKRIKNK